MQQALTNTLPSALWESNGIGSAATFTASSSAFDSSPAPSSLDACAKADAWLVAFDANVNGKGGARFTNAQGLVERDFGSLATSKVIFNATSHSITYKPPVGSHTPDGAKAPTSLTLAPSSGYVTY
jgi:hypothetical protein